MTQFVGAGPNQLQPNMLSGPQTAAGPIKTTTYTSGSGTFTPAVAGGLCHVRMTAPGGGGGRAAAGTQGAGGAGAGVTLDFWVRLDAAVSYTVGAAGVGATTTNTSGTAGGLCRLGTWVAPGGTAGATASGGAAIVVGPGWVAGGKGGSGGNGATGEAGSSPGGVPTLTGAAAGGTASTGGGGGGGGDSTHGSGGAGGNGNATTGAAGANATGYGAGGGGGGAGGSTTGNGGNGSGGIIVIREYGNV